MQKQLKTFKNQIFNKVHFQHEKHYGMLFGKGQESDKTSNKSVVQTTHLRWGNESSLAIVIESRIKIG